MRSLQATGSTALFLAFFGLAVAAGAGDVDIPEAGPRHSVRSGFEEGRTASATPASWRRFSIELSLGPLLGLDRPFRGGLAEAGCSVSLAGLEVGCRARIAYDTVFGATLASADLVLGMGPGMRFTAGGELGLSPLFVREAWGEALLAPLPWPNRFGLAAAIVEFGPRPGSRGGDPPEGGPAMRLFVDAELSWGAYRVIASSRPLDLKSLAGLAGFAAGCRLLLGLRARLGGE